MVRIFLVVTLSLCFISTNSFAISLYIMDNSTKTLNSISNLHKFKIGNRIYVYGDEKELDNKPYLKKIKPKKRYLQYIPNDEFFYEQWGLDNIGQYGYLADFDINWPEAIDAFNTSENAPIVAVIDSGIAWNHPDLRDNILTGGDFGNYGFNFCPYDNINDTYDYIEHGTHVSGIIAAVTDNNFGIAGITDNRVKILNLKVTCGNYDDIDTIAELRAVAKILELKEKGYNIKFANMSFGSNIEDEDENYAIEELINSGVSVFAAAGNDGINEKNYPSAINGVVSVGSVNMYGQISDYSNYGKWVDIYAPGEDIISVDNGYLAKPNSLDLLERYKDFYRNEFESSSDINEINNNDEWQINNGSLSIKLSQNNICQFGNNNGSFTIGPINTFITEDYKYNHLVLRLKLPNSYSSLNIYWSLDNKNWHIVTNQSGFDGSDYFYYYSAIPNELLNSDELYYKFCFEGYTGDEAYIDAIRVSSSDTPDSFVYESGTSMATPFVTAAAALTYLENNSFQLNDLFETANTIYSRKAGDIKVLNLYPLIDKYNLDADTSNTDTSNTNSDNITENPNSSSGGGGCFIATATYGSYLAPDVILLRQFRDKFLLKFDLGKKFVSAYYKYSPKYADIIRNNEILKKIVQIFLLPIIFIIKFPYISLLTFLLSALFIIRKFKKYKKL